MIKKSVVVLIGYFLLFSAKTVEAQQIPSQGENIDYLVTFGKKAPSKWGDEDHVQIFFFVIPKEQRNPIYIRVFDPDVGGNLDQENQGFNSTTSFSVYGGKGAHSNVAARKVNPIGNYRSGVELDSKIFGTGEGYDQNWYNFGPYNPTEGEFVESMDGYVFKIITDGKTGDDGNLYKYFLSTDANRNIAVEGGNGFTYEYSFRLNPKKGSVANLYPFVDDKTVAVIQKNFDYDQGGQIKLYSSVKNGHIMKGSSDGNWSQSRHEVKDAERGKSLNVQILNASGANNDMVFYITNQYNEPMPFFAAPIGGPPKYKYNISISYD